MLPSLLITLTPSQALPKGRYIDNFDGTRPIATILSHDLIKALDQKYRTIRHRSARWIEGFSMGG
jgi:predicted ATP-grasp superfamily ATP-dependent carboligase